MTNHDYLKEKINEVNKIFAKSFVNKIQEISSTDYIFTFSKNSKNQLFLSLNNNNPFFEILTHKITGTLSSKFLSLLKTKLSNAQLLEVKLLNDDNIVSFEFGKITDTYDQIHYSLIFPIFKANSNLILLENDIISLAFRYRGIDTNNPIINGSKYEFPSKTAVFKEISDKDYAFYKNYILDIESKYIKNKYKKLFNEIKKKEKTIAKRLDHILIEKENATKKLEYKDYGDYFLTTLDEHYKGEKSFDYFGKEIPLSEDLSPTKNLEKLYKIYKKAKLSLEINKNLYEETLDHYNYIKNINSSLLFLNEDDILCLIEELENRKIIKKQNAKAQKLAKNPYFVTFNGVKIGFGKNNVQNDNLTFGLAKKSYKFLHIDKDHGSHVVIFDENPSNEVIEFACELVLTLSQKQDGDIQYTEIKNLKKLSELGRVRIYKYEVFHLNKIKKVSIETIKNASRF